MLNLKQKQAIVSEVNTVAKSALSVVVADYRGLTSAQMTDLRAKARQSGVSLRVVRNTLAKRAVEGTDFECVKEVLTGPMLLGFASEEPGATARLLRDFAKENDKLQVKALSLGGTLIDGSQVDVVANLPNKEEAIAKLMSVMQAPIAKFVRTLAAPHTKLVRTLVAVKDQKQ